MTTTRSILPLLGALLLILIMGCAADTSVFVNLPPLSDFNLFVTMEGAEPPRIAGPLSDDVARVDIPLNPEATLFHLGFSREAINRTAPRLDLDRLSETAVEVSDEACRGGRLDGEVLTVRMPEAEAAHEFERETSGFTETGSNPIPALGWRGPVLPLACPLSRPYRFDRFAATSQIEVAEALAEHAVTLLGPDLAIAKSPGSIAVVPRGGNPLIYSMNAILPVAVERTMGIFRVRGTATSTAGTFRIVAVGRDLGATALDRGLIVEMLVSRDSLSFVRHWLLPYAVYDALFEESTTYVVVGRDRALRIRNGNIVDEQAFEDLALTAIEAGYPPHGRHFVGATDGTFIAGNLFGNSTEYPIIRDGRQLGTFLANIVVLQTRAGPRTLVTTWDEGIFTWNPDGTYEDVDAEVPDRSQICGGRVGECGQTTFGADLWGSTEIEDGLLLIVPVACTGLYVHDVTTNCTSAVAPNGGDLRFDAGTGFVSADHLDGTTLVATPNEVFELIQ